MPSVRGTSYSSQEELPSAATVIVRRSSSQTQLLGQQGPHLLYAWPVILPDRIAEKEVSEGPAEMHADGDRSLHHAEPAETVRHDLP